MPVDQANDDVSGWSIDQSAELYRIRRWGHPYFDISDAGNVVVQPDPTRNVRIDLYELAQQLGARGLDLPLIIRFPDIVHDRIRLINESFGRAIREYGYTGGYRGVYPVKVNQQRHLVEAVVDAGRPWRFGLEAGSKPELLIALAAMQDEGGFIICNGYKDLTYIETALVAQQFDNTVIVVLERIEELDVAFQAYQKLGIRPQLGVRAKLSSRGIGRWAKSSGERAKFGLTTAEIVQVVERLAERDMLDCLQLLHFHMGSQVSSIIPIKNALREASNVYVELAKMGCRMEYLDVGGGLAVDYDGSKTDFHASRNYRLDEYAYDVVYAVQEACDRAGLPHPTIVSESGRAIAAYQSVLVFEVVGVDEVRFGQPQAVGEEAHTVIRELYETYRGLAPKNVQEAWHDALQAKQEAQSLFKFGYLGLRELAQAERLFWHVCEKIHGLLPRLKYVPEELHKLEEVLSSIYYCNFSIFQSAPDTWAIDQLFPVVPIHRHDEKPSVKATLADLTCDSDGIIDHFIDVEEVKPVLDVHTYQAGRPYLLGMFLGGAYQEILGDLHNLFGDTNAAHVRIEGEGYAVEHAIRGDSIGQVLRYVQYDPHDMVERVRKQAERALSAGRLTLPQMRVLMRHYEDGLRGYTYLKGEE
ncbi:MAG: biosynthetic arginine decarboxylase [Myxococcota bacterium]